MEEYCEKNIANTISGRDRGDNKIWVWNESQHAVLCVVVMRGVQRAVSDMTGVRQRQTIKDGRY